ncbi:HNH endonuclease [Flexivirga endophytica]|uniref:HNH endonuclease n=1 Tax=Flexivirga endophytica TaxID=1849103 RepID=A0A916WPQ4_9MICO|nr:HNH endonuclease [Flexivirga endophytica]GGB20905.1 HNH endonuclease [Flexivirga endophytica]GHB58715.1 HNH endonuclease [Flexivirga endophytica]
MIDAITDAGEGSAGAFDASVVRAFHDRLDETITGDGLEELLAETRALEEAKNAIAARQARLSVAAHRAQRASDIPRGIDRARTAQKVGSDIALARRSSPHLGSRLLGLAHAMVDEMPNTFAALAAGVIGERDATALVAATACLSKDDRAYVDGAIAGDLGTTSHRRLIATAQAAAYRADPEAATARRARAESERRVSLRPAPDCMTYLTALLPVKDGVACFAALKSAAAATATAEHPRGQVMADTLVERITGRTVATGVDVHVDLVLPLDSLTGDTPADVPGYGPVPADLAREWITDPEKAARIRRLFSYPGTGDLVGMESTARCYTGLLADFIALRDQTCRTPFCDAPIRHTDHITPHTKGGATTERNAQGLCERCNYVKEHPDYLVGGDAGETYVMTGGLTASSRPPAPPGHPPPTKSSISRTLMNIEFAQAVRARKVTAV